MNHFHVACCQVCSIWICVSQYSSVCQWQLNHWQELLIGTLLEWLVSRKDKNCAKKRHFRFRSLILSEKIKSSTLLTQSMREITSLNVKWAENHRQRFHYAKTKVSLKSVSQLLINSGCSVNLWLRQLRFYISFWLQLYQNMELSKKIKAFYCIIFSCSLEKKWLSSI